MSSRRAAPLVLTVAGFDPSGRAGVLADAWAIDRLGAVPLAAVTALTAQGRRFACAPVEARVLGQQLEAALGSGVVRAVKLGMIPHRAALSRIVLALRPGRRPIVIDPVVRTSRGQRLSALTPSDYLQLGRRLGTGQKLVLTPNRAELAWLGRGPEELLRLGFFGVVVKGSESATDELFSRAGHQVLRGTSLPRGPHHRGTGCRFGSGLAAGLARGDDLLTAARRARRLVRKFLTAPYTGASVF